MLAIMFLQQAFDGCRTHVAAVVESRLSKSVATPPLKPNPYNPKP